jgi:group I intron endonuclease
MQEYQVIYNYVTKNMLNGKCYVGMHAVKKGEKCDDGYLGGGKALKLAVRKYGRDGFWRKIIRFCGSVEEAHKWEGVFIKKYDCLYPKGYNLSVDGGNLGVHGVHSDESKKKIGLAQRGRVRSKKERMQISKTTKNRVPWNKGLKGDKRTNIARNKSVFRYTLDGDYVGEFGSIVEAAKKLGVSHSVISRCSHGKTFSAHGFRWSFKKQDKLC